MRIFVKLELQDRDPQLGELVLNYDTKEVVVFTEYHWRDSLGNNKYYRITYMPVSENEAEYVIDINQY